MSTSLHFGALFITRKVIILNNNVAAVVVKTAQDILFNELFQMCYLIQLLTNNVL